MNNDDFDTNEDDLTDDEAQAMVQYALGEILTLASGVADLQSTDEAADEIYALCDLVAAYHGIERDTPVTEEHEDGSFTTRFVRSVPSVDLRKTYASSDKPLIPGHLRVHGNNKRRITDRNSTPDIDDLGEDDSAQ